MQFHLYTSYTISLALLGVIGLLTAGKPLLIIWLEGDAVSSEDIFLMLDILIIIFTSYALGSIAPLGRSILMSTGYHWKVAFVEFLSSVLGILSGLYFMLALDFGVLGMAGGIGLTLLLRGFIFYPIMLSSYFETRLIYLIGESINKSATIFIALFLLMMLFDRIEVFSHFNILFELLQFILICIIWAVLNTILILSNQHKKYLYSFLSKFN